MKSIFKICLFFVMISIIVSGCANDLETLYETESTSYEKEESTEIFNEAAELENNNETADYVGIYAYVKEIDENSILISSDTEELPGVFNVTRPLEAETVDLKEGDYIQILMRHTGEDDEYGLPIYREKRIVVLEEKYSEGLFDVLFTEPPTFDLTDVLSSQLNSFEIKSGNYVWNVRQNGEMKCINACGLTPMEEAKTAMRLKLPEYYKTNSVTYSFSTKILPDILTVSEWNAKDIGNNSEDKKVVSVYYYKQPLLELEKGKVYEFLCDWKKENIGINGFYGTASYVLVTE